MYTSVLKNGPHINVFKLMIFFFINATVYRSIVSSNCFFYISCAKHLHETFTSRNNSSPGSGISAKFQKEKHRSYGHTIKNSAVQFDWCKAIVEFFLSNTDLTFLAFLYKIDIEGFQNEQK